MKKVILYADGASRGNPGPAGAGFALIDEEEMVVFEGHLYLGETTNNQAEYSALIDGLERALKMGFESVEIRMDSELVVKQIRGEYKVKNEGLKPKFVKAKDLLSKFGAFKIGHVPREQNKIADKLANKAIDETNY